MPHKLMPLYAQAYRRVYGRAYLHGVPVNVSARMRPPDIDFMASQNLRDFWGLSFFKGLALSLRPY